jgi:predicted pyridoxine 5'-phosphate oxidase superfamily flavin-nucleotide-binding protein
MLTDDMKRVVTEQRLGFVATVNADGTPNLSPKATFVVLDDTHLAYGDLRSPRTAENIANGSVLEVNFVDPFSRKGYRFRGRAAILARDTPEFVALVAQFGAWANLVGRMRSVVKIRIERALPLVSPAYDVGTTEAELRQTWRAHYARLNDPAH